MSEIYLRINTYNPQSHKQMCGKWCGLSVGGLGVGTKPHHSDNKRRVRRSERRECKDDDAAMRRVSIEYGVGGVWVHTFAIQCSATSLQCLFKHIYIVVEGVRANIQGVP